MRDFPYRIPSPISDAANTSIGEGATFAEMEAMATESWDEEIQKAVKRGLEVESWFNKDFYVEVSRRRENHPEKNELHDINRFIIKAACPTPQWNQSVYKYHRRSGLLQFLWTVPRREVCAILKYYALQLNEDEKTLLDYVLEFENGKLLELARLYNKETDDQPQIALIVK